MTDWEEPARLGTVAVRCIFRPTERTILDNSQHLLLPEPPLEGWDTTLPESFDAQAVIALYADHGTHKQFHVEIKADLDMECLPSGKFATNDLVPILEAMAYNLMRVIEKQTLLGPDAPPRHPAKRRRVKTVIQEIVILVAHCVCHARRQTLSFPAYTLAFAPFQRPYAAWSAP